MQGTRHSMDRRTADMMVAFRLKPGADSRPRRFTGPIVIGAALALFIAVMLATASIAFAETGPLSADTTSQQASEPAAADETPQDGGEAATEPAASEPAASTHTGTGHDAKELCDAVAHALKADTVSPRDADALNSSLQTGEPGIDIPFDATVVISGSTTVCGFIATPQEDGTLVVRDAQTDEEVAFLEALAVADPGNTSNPAESSSPAEPPNDPTEGTASAGDSGDSGDSGSSGNSSDSGDSSNSGDSEHAGETGDSGESGQEAETPTEAEAGTPGASGAEPSNPDAAPDEAKQEPPASESGEQGHAGQDISSGSLDTQGIPDRGDSPDSDQQESDSSEEPHTYDGEADELDEQTIESTSPVQADATTVSEPAVDTIEGDVPEAGSPGTSVPVAKASQKKAQEGDASRIPPKSSPDTTTQTSATVAPSTTPSTKSASATQVNGKGGQYPATGNLLDWYWLSVAAVGALGTASFTCAAQWRRPEYTPW